MATTLKEKLTKLSPDRQKKIEARTAELVSEEMTRQELRQSLKFTQDQIAQILQIDQGNVSRIEQRTDLMLSTLRKYIEAMGGELQIAVKLPNGQIVTLVGIFETEDSEEKSSITENLIH
ncbi:XRE family transcriptional regulator [Fischerella sp. PCC 9605]|uniref:XRE family transcriptional regulator n=1 Tax=Fischerella sp. PCC 9605 TaxID=1173024 RepID=UPI00047EA924|nr:XRE family transcriptional regulator [Fischerella sp. PCC 9605]